MSNKRRAKQSAGIFSPTKHDVVFGKGVRIQNLPGNVHYRKIIRDKAFLDYSNAKSRERKDGIVNAVIEVIPGRFLAKNEDDGKFYALEKEVVRTKIKQAIRDCKKQAAREAQGTLPRSTSKKPRGNRLTCNDLELLVSPIKNNATIKKNDQTIDIEPLDFRTTDKAWEKNMKDMLLHFL